MKLKYFLVLITSFLFMNVVHANEIRSINMDIYVDNNGDAHIKETWIATLNNGTEGYKLYYNLGTSDILDYRVKMDNIEFTTISNWNKDASFIDKSYRAGIHKIEDGYELCFGISKYGLNTYELNYTITNFVVGLNDSDMIYWTLVPHNLSDKPESVHIKIYSDFKYEDTLDVWGYGNDGGLAYVHDGYIEMNSEGELDTYEYMTILVKYPKDTFNTSTKINKKFNYYYKKAKKGSINSKKIIDKITNIMYIILNIIKYIIILLALALPFICGLILLKRKRVYGTKNLQFNKGITKIKKAPYFRDIPCNKNIFEAYWVACQFELVDNINDFLGSVLLKWIKDKNIEKDSSNKEAIRFKNKKNLTDVEIELYDLMKEASVDGVLEAKEFIRYSKKHYSKLLKWFDKEIDEQTMKYVEKGLIIKSKDTYLVKDEMKEYALQMAGLKKFLNDFSNIKDRESIEVMLWQEYLMYAQIFGIADKVAKEFKDLYPDVITEEVYSDFEFINNLSYDSIHAAVNARTSYQKSYHQSSSKKRDFDYSSGGGGYSSKGGGSGSFGGGSSGGGGFR